MALETLTALAVLDGLPAAVAVVSTDGVVLLANRRWRESAGSAEGALVAQLARGWGMPDEHGAAVAASLRSAYAESPAAAIEWQHEQGGVRRSLQLQIRPMQGSDAQLAQVDDVSAERRAQQALQRLQLQMSETEERFRCFSEVTSETMVINENGRILFVNEAVRRMFGRTPEEVVGHSVLEFVAPESQQEVVRQLSSAQSSQLPYEFIGVRKDGCRFYGEVLGKQILYHGRPVRGASILDVTARKRAEEEIRQRLLAEERIRAEAAALSALETPLIPISDSVMVMPLIGTLDVARMERATEALLNGIQGGRVLWAILDITGVPSLEGATAAALVRAARGARLLGSQVILSGVRGEVAQALVRMGAELTGVVTQPALQGAIAHALSRTKLDRS